MNSNWIQKSLEYHGLPLKSIWDGERGDQELVNLGLTRIDYTTYRKRTQNQDTAERRVRFKLHSFIAKNAPALFDNNLLRESDVSSTTIEVNTNRTLEHIPSLFKAPPFECFLSPLEPGRRERIYSVRKQMVEKVKANFNYLFITIFRILRSAIWSTETLPIPPGVPVALLARKTITPTN